MRSTGTRARYTYTHTHTYLRCHNVHVCVHMYNNAIKLILHYKSYFAVPGQFVYLFSFPSLRITTCLASLPNELVPSSISPRRDRRGDRVVRSGPPNFPFDPYLRARPSSPLPPSLARPPPPPAAPVSFFFPRSTVSRPPPDVFAIPRARVALLWLTMALRGSPSPAARRNG